MSILQVIFIIVIAIYSIVVTLSLFSQSSKGGSLLYKFYLYTLVGLVVLGIPLANGIISVVHIAIGVVAGVVLLALQISVFGKSEVIGQRVWPWDAAFLMLNKQRRKAITFAKNEEWQEARAIFESLLSALPNGRKHKRMVCMHDITTCCANLGDSASIKAIIDTARAKYPKDAAFILQLYHNFFDALKKQELPPSPEHVQQLEQYVSENINRLSKYKFTPENGTALKGISAAKALVVWATPDADCQKE